MSTHDSVDSAGLPCEGSWEQDVFGRQPMRELVLRFNAGRIVGSGHDIIGPFAISGVIAADGKVVLFKRYVGMHAVRYIGNYDGEGLMWGQWWIESLHNRWLIKLNTSRVPVLEAAEIEAIM